MDCAVARVERVCELEPGLETEWELFEEGEPVDDEAAGLSVYDTVSVLLVRVEI